MEKFRHPEIPENYEPEKSKEDVYEKIETTKEIDVETREKLLESINISQVVAVLQNMLQNHDIEDGIILKDFLDELGESQINLRRENTTSDANILESMEGIIRDAITAGHAKEEMTIGQLIDSFSLRWSELSDYLEKKGLKL